jgi:hypothetical protein
MFPVVFPDSRLLSFQPPTVTYVLQTSSRPIHFKYCFHYAITVYKNQFCTPIWDHTKHKLFYLDVKATHEWFPSISCKHFTGTHQGIPLNPFNGLTIVPLMVLPIGNCIHSLLEFPSYRMQYTFTLISLTKFYIVFNSIILMFPWAIHLLLLPRPHLCQQLYP